MVFLTCSLLIWIDWINALRQLRSNFAMASAYNTESLCIKYIITEYVCVCVCVFYVTYNKGVGSGFRDVYNSYTIMIKRLLPK